MEKNNIDLVSLKNNKSDCENAKNETMQNDQWNFDISEMTISSESSCSLSNTTPTETPLLANRITQDEVVAVVGSGNGDGVFLSPSIVCDSVEYEKALREVDEVVQDANKSDRIGDSERKSDNVEIVEKESVGDGDKDKEEDRNELVRLPGGEYLMV